MFANIVKNQYVGKSKLDFTLNGNLIDPKMIIGDIGLPLVTPQGCPLVDIDRYFPDYFITGTVSDISTLELIPNDMDKAKVLLITGIPKNAPSLDKYRMKEVTWSSYYEDDYRGYLFQIVNANTTLELKEPTYEVPFKFTIYTV